MKTFVVYNIGASAQVIPFSENLHHQPPRRLICRARRTGQMS